MTLNGLRPVNFVAVGGGTGLATLLAGLKLFVGASADSLPAIARLSAIVAVSDDGGSSGRLRDELDMPAPGDLRNCMVALSEDSNLLAKLFQFRFGGEGELSGHSFGNLFLAAMTEVTGDFADAVKLSSEVLASKGHIYPATVSNVRLAAELDDGSIVRGETKVGKVGRNVKRLFLEPADCLPMPEVLEAIEGADIISIGPGSLFTSLLPPLLVPQVTDAIRGSRAVKVLVCNLMTQPGETDGLTARDHLTMFSNYVPELRFHHLIVNSKPVSPSQAAAYMNQGADQIGIHGSISGEAIEGAHVVYANLLDEGDKVRHHPERLARSILNCLNASQGREAGPAADSGLPRP